MRRPIRTFAKISGALTALGLLMGCTGRIDTPDRVIPAGQELPIVGADQSMPLCGTGWRQDPPLIGLKECARPFVFQPPENKTGSAFGLFYNHP